MIAKFMHISKSANDTLELGKLLSGQLKKGDIIGLDGDLGTGKTTFAKGILSGLNYDGNVVSPTFTLINEYSADMYVVHADFYREENIERWLNLGFEETMYNSDLVIIEWPSLIPNILPEDIDIVNFEHAGDDTRKIYLR